MYWDERQKIVILTSGRSANRPLTFKRGVYRLAESSMLTWIRAKPRGSKTLIAQITPRSPTYNRKMVRYKARYLLFNVLYPSAASTAPPSAPPKHIDFLSPSDPSISPGDLATLLRDTIAHNFGDWGSGVAGNLSIKYFSPTTSTGIVRVGREHYRLVWAALTYIREIKGRPCVVRVVHVSGTIKKAEVEAVRRAKRDISLVEGQEQGEEALVGIADVDDDDDDDVDMG